MDKYEKLRERYLRFVLCEMGSVDTETFEASEIHEEGDEFVLVEPGWYARESECQVEDFYTDCDALEAAQQYVDSGDWGEPEETIWVKVTCSRRAWRVDADGDVTEEAWDAETHKITVEPTPPKCESGDPDDHEWERPHEVVGGIEENPGCWGHGGGIRTNSVCKHCGAYCITDSWAQDRTDGEQGLYSVRYEEADRDSLEWVATRHTGDWPSTPEGD